LANGSYAIRYCANACANAFSDNSDTTCDNSNTCLTGIANHIDASTNDISASSNEARYEGGSLVG
jgi:hypothetical protein